MILSGIIWIGNNDPISFKQRISFFLLLLLLTKSNKILNIKKCLEKYNY